MVKFRILFTVFVFTALFTEAGKAFLINDPPIAQNQNLVTPEDTPLLVTLTGSDSNGDVLTFNIVQGPLHGILSGNPPNLNYLPNRDFNGFDSFTFNVNDGNIDSEIATVTITVIPINDAPEPNNLLVSVQKNKSKNILLSATDVDNQSLAYSINSSPTHGVLTGTGQDLTYTPESNYTGSDAFTFLVSDGMGSGIGTVTITVEDVNRYMVFFNDKQGTPYSIDSPEEFLSIRSLQRRAINEVNVSEEDLPVSPMYVSGLESIGAKTLYKTKWMNGVMVEATPSQIDEIELLEYVKSTEYIAPGERPLFNARVRSKKLTHQGAAANTSNSVQNSMIGLDVMHGFNFRGEGILVAIMDAGFVGADTIRYFRHIFNEGRFDAVTSYNFVSGGNNVFVGDPHGTNVWSIMGAYKAGVYTGGVYKANFVLFVTEYDPSEYRVEEYNWLFAAERADSVGVDVINTSLGYSIYFNDVAQRYTTDQMNGTTAVISIAANYAAEKGIAVVVSAGNEGNVSSWKIITAPADVASVLSVGGVTSTGQKVNTSSIGPTADGRVKPDVAAMGSGVSLVGSDGVIRTGSGTSFASPLAASLVAGLRQKYPTITVAQLFDSVRMNATQSLTPDNLLGYGIPSFANFVTGITPESNKPTLTVYPIPTGVTCYLQFSEPNEDELRCSLFDSRGTSLQINATREDDFRYSLDLTACKPGLYVLRIQRGRDLYTHKIIKSE